MTKRTIAESFEVAGIWNLPETPNHRIAGRLRYKVHRSELELSSALLASSGVMNLDSGPRAYPVIHGTTDGGEAITLLDSSRISQSFNLGRGGLQQPEVIATSTLFIGAHLREAAAFSRMSFRVPGLAAWLSRPAIEETISGAGVPQSQLPTFRVLPIDAEIVDIQSLGSQIEWTYSWDYSSNEYTAIALQVHAWITVRSFEPKSAKWHFEQYARLSTILSLMAGSTMAPDCIDALVDDEEQPIEVLIEFVDHTLCAHRFPSDFFVSRAMLGDGFGKLVERWLSACETVHFPSRLATSALAPKETWQHIKFMSLMQSLEAYHRCRYPGIYVDEETYRAIEKVMRASIPGYVKDDHRSALQSRLKYGNQISLQKRLNQLAESLPVSVSARILGADGKVPRRWVDARNYFTHWDEGLRSEVLDARELYWANFRLGCFLRVLYLAFVGVTEDVLLRALDGRSEVAKDLAQADVGERFDCD